MIIESILDAFENFRMPPILNDEYLQKGRAVLTDKIDAFVRKHDPLRFSMLGYPMKSPNFRDKVLGTLPDLGEKLSFENFARFARTIEDIYSPGVQFSFISDGFIFSDIMQVSDRIVEQYIELCKQMSKAAGVPVTWFEMTDFYDRRLGMQAIREKIMTQYGITSEELERRILYDANVNHLYRGMLYFIEGDLAIREFPSRNQLHKQSKIVAREMMFRNEAYSSLIQSEFSDHIRLSMHPSTNDGTKFSFQLVPSPLARHSPWHSAILRHKDGPVETVHKKDAIAAGHELVNVNGQPFYFQEV